MALVVGHSRGLERGDHCGPFQPMPFYGLSSSPHPTTAQRDVSRSKCICHHHRKGHDNVDEQSKEGSSRVTHAQEMDISTQTRADSTNSRNKALCSTRPCTISNIYIYIKIQFGNRRMQQEIISCVSFAQVWRQTRISGERLACRAGSAVPGPQYLVL